jgi:hypothetical protein
VDFTGPNGAGRRADKTYEADLDLAGLEDSQPVTVTAVGPWREAAPVGTSWSGRLEQIANLITAEESDGLPVVQAAGAVERAS